MHLAIGENVEVRHSDGAVVADPHADLLQGVTGGYDEGNAHPSGQRLLRLPRLPAQAWCNRLVRQAVALRGQVGLQPGLLLVLCHQVPLAAAAGKASGPQQGRHQGHSREGIRATKGRHQQKGRHQVLWMCGGGGGGGRNCSPLTRRRPSSVPSLLCCLSARTAAEGEQSRRAPRPGRRRPGRAGAFSPGPGLQASLQQSRLRLGAIRRSSVPKPASPRGNKKPTSPALCRFFSALVCEMRGEQAGRYKQQVAFIRRQQCAFFI